MDVELIALITFVAVVLLLLVVSVNYIKAYFKTPCEAPLLSQSEREFYGVLCQLCANRAIVLCKIRLPQLSLFAAGCSKWSWNYRQFQAQQFDFVICRNSDCKPIAVVEFDGGGMTVKLSDIVIAQCVASKVRVYRFNLSSINELAVVEAQLFPEQDPRFTQLESGLQLPIGKLAKTTGCP